MDLLVGKGWGDSKSPKAGKRWERGSWEDLCIKLSWLVGGSKANKSLKSSWA